MARSGQDDACSGVTRRSLIIVAAFGGLTLIGLVVGAVLLVNYLIHSESLPTIHSPDGSWSITLTAKPVVFGGVEVVAVSEDQRAGRKGPYVVGRAASFSEFRKTYRRVKIVGDAAWLDGKGISLRPGVKTWPAAP